MDNAHKYSTSDKEKARKECCNYMNKSCVNKHACWVQEDLDCAYFNRVVSKI